MIVEIVEQGGIYAYYQNEKCFYVGKTTRNFKERDYEHKNGTSLFDNFYKQNPNLELKILIDCSFCKMTKEQLDYLETCFIQTLQPNLNQNKIQQNISNKENFFIKKEDKENIYKKLTKNEILIYETIKSLKNLTITKKEILQNLKVKISSRTLDRALKKLCELNFLILKYTNSSNENIYEIVEKENE